MLLVADGELRVRSLARRDAWAPMFGEAIAAYKVPEFRTSAATIRGTAAGGRFRERV